MCSRSIAMQPSVALWKGMDLAGPCRPSCLRGQSYLIANLVHLFFHSRPTLSLFSVCVCLCPWVDDSQRAVATGLVECGSSAGSDHASARPGRLGDRRQGEQRAARDATGACCSSRPTGLGVRRSRRPATSHLGRLWRDIQGSGDVSTFSSLATACPSLPSSMSK
jgi:hypothetical protein